MERLTRTGHVAAIRDGRAEIRIELPSACMSCGSRGACAGAATGSPTVFMSASALLRPGEAVTVLLPEGRLVAGALRAYLLPAGATLLGAVLPAGAGDAAAIAGAVAGLALGLAAGHVAGRRALRRGAAGMTITSGQASICNS